MSIEENLFKKVRVNFDKLISYGFKREKDKYLYSKDILNGSFRVDVEISDDAIIKGKIIDLSFNEEYNNYRIEGITGEFVNTIRKEFENILIDIKNNCCTEKDFITEQANRISNIIIEKYGDMPEFAWNKFPGYGIFRNPNNEKWYALIMNVDKNKIGKGNGEVEIINVKLTEEEITTVLPKNGFYKAYHMNKKNWISIILDNTLTDDEIMEYIMKSHKFTEKPNEWIIPANPKYYDVINCFNNTDTIMWKQSNNTRVGDVIYLYVAAPYSAILYKCEVLEVNIPYEYKDKNVAMSKVMKVRLLQKYDEKLYPFEKLNKYGIKAIRGPRSMPKKLSTDINTNR